MFTDIAYRCPQQALLRGMANNTFSELWAYSFDRTPPCGTIRGAYHSAEIEYVFNQLDITVSVPNCSIPRLDHEIADRIGALWTEFAANGKPAKAWPRFFDATNGNDLEYTLRID